MKVNRECRYFKGNEPCEFHKLKGVICKCRYYQPIDFKILIIQCGGIGDIIKTTPILRKLKQEYPDSN